MLISRDSGSARSARKRRVQGCAAGSTPHDLRQQVTNGVVKSLQLTGVDTTHFSGMSMHIGGLSASFSANIPEAGMHLQ